MKKKIILASASPRRQQLLKDLAVDFTIQSSDVEEIYPADLPMEKVPEYLARLKAEDIFFKNKNGAVVIGADTVVILGNKILGKPADKAMAKNMLQQLSGESHSVITGVCIINGDEKHIFSNHTEVYFNRLTDKEIDYYLDHFQPYDKAGSYAIQEWIGKIGIRRIDGDYFNVMGLPLSMVYQKLRDLGVI